MNVENDYDHDNDNDNDNDLFFFSVRAIVYKILVRTMLLVRADLQRKVIGVFVPLDLRVRFAKEVTITSVLISRGLQQFNGKTLLRCLLIGS